MKEEIYKIVKYQTKLAEADSDKQQGLYKNKLSEHISNLTNHGVKKEMVFNMMQNGGSGVLDLLTKQKNATIAALDNIKTKGDEDMNAVNQTKQEIITNTNNAVLRHSELFSDYKTDITGAFNSMIEIENAANGVNINATQNVSLKDLQNELNKLLNDIKDPKKMIEDLSEELKKK
jgi:hypothetical protein